MNTKWHKRLLAAACTAALFGQAVPPALAAPGWYDAAQTQDSIVVYINLDGFSNTYLEKAVQGGYAPTFKWIMEQEGVYFPNARVDLPSITTPTQARIVSGTTARYTGMYDRMFDKTTGELVKPQTRYTEAITQTTNRHDIPSLSVDYFILERDNAGLSKETPEAYYFDTPANQSHGVGEKKAYDDAADRFDRLIAMLKSYDPATGTVTIGLDGDPGQKTLSEMPRFLSIYADDIDSYAHNYEPKYRYTEKAKTEAERQQRVMDAISRIDAKIGELIQACKDAGLYDRMSFVLSADHGMTAYGLESQTAVEALDLTDDGQRIPSPARPQGGYQDALPQGKVGVPLTCESPVLTDIEALGEGFTCVYAENTGAAGKEEYLSRVSDPDIVLTSSGDAMIQLSFVNEFDPAIIDRKCDQIIQALSDKYYMQGGRFVKGTEAASEFGVGYGYADLLISLAAPYFNFAAYGKEWDSYTIADGTIKQDLVQEYGQSVRKDADPTKHPGGVITDFPEGGMYARGAHDSLDEDSQGIAMLMWGNQIKDGYTVTDVVKNSDLAGTMCTLLGINAPLDSTGDILYDALDGIQPPVETGKSYAADALNATMTGGVATVAYHGSTALTGLRAAGDSFQITVPDTAQRLELTYTTARDVKLHITHNNVSLNVNEVFFPMTQAPVAPASTQNYDDYDLQYGVKTLNLDVQPGDTLTFTPVDGWDASSFGLSQIRFVAQQSAVFEDVQPGDWFAPAVSYVYDNQLMRGDSATRFAPEKPATRATLWAVLARLAGQDTTSSDPWYRAAQQWVKANDLSDGSDPNQPLPREQLISMLYRFAQQQGMDTTQGGMAVREFDDAAQISAYAEQAMAWAVHAGLITGDQGQLLPQATASRAETAVILMRFAEHM